MISRLLPFALILIAVALFFGYAKPLWDGEIMTLTAEIETYDNALAAARTFNSEVTRLQQEQSQIPPADLARLQAFLPNGVDNIQLILDLTELAERSGIELSNFDTPTPAEEGVGSAGTGELEPSSPVDSLTISVDAQGTYADFRTFLAGIERSLRPLDVTQVSIGNSETGVYSYQMTLKFYWLR